MGLCPYWPLQASCNYKLTKMVHLVLSLCYLTKSLPQPEEADALFITHSAVEDTEAQRLKKLPRTI